MGVHIRDLIAELVQIEDARRQARHRHLRGPEGGSLPELIELAQREGEVLRQLRHHRTSGAVRALRAI